jgi:hypothetical protein
VQVTEGGAELVEGRVDALLHLGGVGIRQLVDDDEEGVGGRVVAGQDRVADERLVVLDHGGDVTEGQAVRVVDGDLGEVGRLDDGQVVLDADALRRRVDEAAGPRAGRLEEGERRHPQGRCPSIR